MTDNITIPLATPIKDHTGVVTAIVIREPTFDEYLRLGEPYEVAASPDGARFAVQNAETVRAYLDLCMVAPSTPDLLAAAGIKVARQVRAAILGFFQDGDEADEASKTSPTSSSSVDTPTSTPAPSAA